MAGFGTVQIPALPGFIRALSGFQKDFGEKVLRKSLRRLANGVRDDANALEAGIVGQSLKVRIRKSASGMVAIVEPAPGRFPIPKGSGFVRIRYFSPRRVAHLIERGTKARFTKSGASRGSMRARPFIGPAFNLAVPKAETIFAYVLDQEIARAVR